MEYYYDISAGSDFRRHDMNSTGDNSQLLAAQAPGLSYDEVQHRIVGWRGGSTYYVLEIGAGPTFTWFAVSPNGTGPSAHSQGTYGRWQYVPSLNALVTVNVYNVNAYALRATNDAGAGLGPLVFFAARD